MTRGWAGAFLLGLLSGNAAAFPPVSQFESQDYQSAVSSSSWAQPPSDHHRLFLDVYNVTDFYDAETGGVAGFTAQTVISDTLRPTATVLWDERFRIQLGVIAQKIYGDRVGFGSVDPWVQTLWQPVRSFSVVLGNLDTPHYYLPALFDPTRYFINENHETGLQFILKKPELYDDLYFNYRLRDTPAHNEKFDFGFVHRNLWKVLAFDYQAHWIHEGGELNPHPVGTFNDVSQAVGAGVQGYPLPTRSLMLGAGYARLISHQRQDAGAPLGFRHDGGGNLTHAFVRFSRVKLIFRDWRGQGYSHESGDPMFTLPVLDMLTLRGDLLLSNDFNLFGEATAYIVGSNSQGYGHDVKAVLRLQASWQFSIPIVEWSSPAASPEGQPVPARWDYGI